MDFMELQAMLETPELTGRGKPCAVILGAVAAMNILHEVPFAVYEDNPKESPLKRCMTLLGLPVYVPERHPHAAFAVTQGELEQTLQRVGPLLKRGDTIDVQHSDDNPVREPT